MYFIHYKHFFYFSSFKSLETPIQNVDTWCTFVSIPEDFLLFSCLPWYGYKPIQKNINVLKVLINVNSKPLRLWHQD